VGRIRTAWNALTNRDLASDAIGWQYRRNLPMGGAVNVTQETALRHSAWWACLRLRADVISTTPLDAFRARDGLQVEVTKPTLLTEPSPGVHITEHLYSSQFDLDRYGNSVGIVTSRNAFGLPASVELVPMSDVSAICNGSRVKLWRIGRDEFQPVDIWHERQFTVGGWALGLSPLAYAAWTVGGYLSAQQFAIDWFSTGAAPTGTLRNTERTLVKDLAPKAKAEFKQAVENRDIFVTGKDWEWIPAQADAASTGFLESQRAGVLDVCRYLGVPGDMIDAEIQSGSVTYANVTQRNLQLLIMNLGPAYIRREAAFTRALPQSRFVKFNTDGLLRMDPQTREGVILSQVGKTLTYSEARRLDNRPPFTDADLAELGFMAQLGKPLTPTTKQAAQPWEVPA